MLKAKKFMLFIVLALVIQVFGVAGMLSASAEDPVITIGTATTTAGQGVYIPININNVMTGIHNAHIVISYDTTQLTFDQATASSIIPVSANFTSSNSNGQIILNYTDNSVDGDEITTTGEFAKISFWTSGLSYPNEGISISLVTADTYFTLYNDATQAYENVTNLPHQDGYVTIVANNNAAITVDTASGTPGSTISIPIRIGNYYSNIFGVNIKLKFDPAQITFKTLSAGNVFYPGDLLNYSISGDYITLYEYVKGSQPIKSPGVFVTLIFTVNSTATPGKARLSVTDDSYYNIYFDSIKMYRDVNHLPRTNGVVTVNAADENILPAITVDHIYTPKGTFITVPVRIGETATGIHAANIVLNYDPAKLVYSSTNPGILMNGGTIFTVNNTNGQLTMTFDDNGRTGNELMTPGVLAYVNFFVPPNVMPPQNLTISVDPVNTSCRIYYNSTQEYKWVNHLPNVDGIVTVQ